MSGFRRIPDQARRGRERRSLMADAGGICISASVIEQVEGRIEIVLDDLGVQQFKNIARSVQVYAVRGYARPAEPLANPPPVADKPSVAVLPFDNMSGDSEQEFFADGMTEDIITALSRFHSLFVIARNSSFSYKGRSPDVRDAARELGVRYIVEGSIRRAGKRLADMDGEVDHQHRQSANCGDLREAEEDR